RAILEHKQRTAGVVLAMPPAVLRVGDACFRFLMVLAHPAEPVTMPSSLSIGMRRPLQPSWAARFRHWSDLKLSMM
ncbi:MAG: hypothetical protein M0R03_10120, partial [Novosphingobium sp.]|nr:hypothetical protein [Novosphingobium sp.]